jgi:hypothetical protein
MSTIGRNPLESCQNEAFEVALELARLDHRLARIAESLPLPVDVEDLFNDYAASTPSVHLYGAIGTVKEELWESIEMLLRASQADEASLRQSHRKVVE